MDMSLPKSEAIVLKRADFRETSLIVNFYSRSFGKLSMLLKGIRTEPQKFASTLEPFSLNDIIFYRKRNSSLHLLSQCDIKDNFSPLRQSVFKVSVASMMMELLDVVMPPEDPNPEIFDLALACLKEMETNNNTEKILTIFKIKLLKFSGFKPHFDSCVCCEDKISGQAEFSLSLGGLLCPACIKKDIAARQIFRGTVATIMHIEKNELKNSFNLGLNPQIKKELDLVLNSFINFHLGKELKAQKVLEAVK
jgi:DNA repair protein RecO (recombination protein O)